MSVSSKNYKVDLVLPDRGREHGGQSGERPCGCQGSAEERVSTSI